MSRLGTASITESYRFSADFKPPARQTTSTGQFTTRPAGPTGSNRAVPIREASLDLRPAQRDQAGLAGAVVDPPGIEQRHGLRCGVIADDRVGMVADDRR
jgi:hypothetical protein